MVMGVAAALMAVTSTSRGSIPIDKKVKVPNYLCTRKERRPRAPHLSSYHLPVCLLICLPTVAPFWSRVKILVSEVFKGEPRAKWMKLLHSFVLNTNTNRHCHIL